MFIFSVFGFRFTYFSLFRQFSLSFAYAFVLARCFENSFSLWYPQSFNFFVSPLHSVFDFFFESSSFTSTISLSLASSVNLLLSHVHLLCLWLSLFLVVSSILSVFGIHSLTISSFFDPSLCL